MGYYAVAMTVTLILCYYKTTVYSMPDGLEAKAFPNWKTAFLVLLPLTLVAVFRWNVGWDSAYGSSYWTAYHAAADGVNIREFEIGFYYLTRFIAIFELPFFWYLFILGTLFMLFVSRAISKGSVWTKWSILIFFLLSFYFDSYSSLRQSLAQAIALMAWADMGYLPASKKKDIRIILIFIIAGLFHQIALINIPIYIISRIRFSRGGLLKFIIAAVIVSPVLQTILRFVASLMASEYDTSGVARLNMLMTGVIALFCWYFYDEVTSFDENAYMYVNFGVCIFVLIMNSGAMPIPYRVFDMLKIGYVFIVPYVLRAIRSKRIRLTMEFVFLLIFGAWFYNFYFIQDPIFAYYNSVFTDFTNIINLP